MNCRPFLVRSVCVSITLSLLFAALASRNAAAMGRNCFGPPRPWRMDLHEAKLIVYGTLANARGDVSPGSTDLVIEQVLKSHPLLKPDQKIITLPRCLPADPKDPQKFVVFFDVHKNELDPYRSTRATPAFIEYLKSVMAIEAKDHQKILANAFKFLESADLETSGDAFLEFGLCDYKDFRPVAEKLPADRIAGWLKDPKTPPSRIGLYGSMLGHCGTDREVPILQLMIENANPKYANGLDGLLVGYAMLKPNDGWTHLRQAVADETREFLLRWQAFRAARFFVDFRPDLVSKAMVAETLANLLDQKDFADVAIEELRKWGYWKYAERVIELSERSSHDLPIIRRAILRYALSCPTSASASAARFVEEMKKKDPELVKETDELLKLESAPVPPAAPSGKSK